ncbi:MAG: CocE/NonD family hydrolase [Deltaproteobacteria bacterium]
MNRMSRAGLCLVLAATGCSNAPITGGDGGDVAAADARVDATDTGSPDLDSAMVDDTPADTIVPVADAPADDVPVPPADASTGSPAGTGPYTVTRTTPAVTGATVVVFDPAVPAGTRAPIVMFKHGFQLSTANYATMLAQIASHGYIVVSVDSGGGLIGGPTQVQERDAVITALGWAVSSAAPFAAHADAAHVAAMGHSRGGKIAVMVAAADPRVSALVGLDPVNACGPGQAYSADCPDVTMGAFAPVLSMPIGLMGETADAAGGFMPCAPAAQNYATIYRATSASTWVASWTIAGAAHMTFTDDGGGFAGAFCAAATGNVATIREEILTLAVAFLDRHLHGDTSRDPWLTGALVPTSVTLEHH